MTVEIVPSKGAWFHDTVVWGDTTIRVNAIHALQVQNYVVTVHTVVGVFNFELDSSAEAQKAYENISGWMSGDRSLDGVADGDEDGPAEVISLVRPGKGEEDQSDE